MAGNKGQFAAYLFPAPRARRLPTVRRVGSLVTTLPATARAYLRFVCDVPCLITAPVPIQAWSSADITVHFTPGAKVT